MPEKFGMGGPVPSGQIPLQNVESRTNALRGVAENAPAELRDLLQSKLQPGQQMPNITDANSARQALNSLLIPEKEAALASANIGNQRIIPLREIAADEANRAANSVDTVRRLGNTGQTAQNLADSGSMNLSRNPPYMNDVGNPRLSGRYSYADELAKRAEGALGEPAQQSLMHGGASRLAAEAAQGLESQGYKPLSVNSLIAAIDSKLATPGVGIVPDNSAVLNAVKAKLKEAGGNSGGYVNAIDLDAIRSKVINNTIEDLMKDANPARRGQAAGLAMDMKDAVKQAIESVGGKGYIKHLEEYTTGRKNVGDMQNADSLVGKYRNALDKESPQSFATELRNLDNPPHSPELNKAVSGVTDSLVRGQKYDANARAGNSEVARMIGSEVLPTLPGVGPMSMKISLVRNLINRFSGNLTESSLKNIAKIADDPAKILEAIKRRDISPSEHRVLEMLLHQNMAKGASASIPSNRLSDLVKEQ